MKTTAKTLLTLLIVIVMSQTALSIGISPGLLNFDNVFRGGYGEKTLTLSTGGDEDLFVVAKFEGQGAPWLTLQPNLVNARLKKDSPISFKVKLQLPPTVGTGCYNASLVVSTVSSENISAGGVSGAKFMPGLIVPIIINVTGEELLDYEVTRFTVGDAEKDELIEYSIVVKNKGNVMVTPNMTVEILSADKSKVITTAEVNAISILPSTEGAIDGSLSSEGMKIGTYWLRLTPYIRDRVLNKREVDFKIVEVGTISLTGVFSDLIIPQKAVPGDKIKITAYFNNTCDKVLEAQSSCEVLVAGKLLDTVESKTLRVSSGSVAELTSYFDVPSEGNYNFRCYIDYQNKQTDTIERVLVAGATASQSDYSSYIIYILVGLTTLILIYILYSRFKGGRR